MTTVTVADQVERGFAQVNQLSQQLVEEVAAGKGQGAIGRIQELTPVLAQVEEEVDRLIELENAEFSAGLAKLTGRLGIVNLVTSGRFSRSLNAIASDASRTFEANRFARALSRELFLYSSSVAAARQDRGIEAAQEDTRDALSDWRTLAGTRTAGTRAREVTALTTIERDYSRIRQAEIRLLPLIAGGHRDVAAELLAQEFEPASDQISPIVDEVVAADASQLQAALSTFDGGLKVVLGVVGIVSVLGLAVALAGPILINRQIIRPVVRLRDLAIRLGAGDLHVRAPIVSNDEVGDLSSAFNQMAADLENRTREMRALGELGDLLQACTTVEEACQVFIRTARELFPEDSGAVFVFAPSRDILEPMVNWGEPSSNSAFAPDECWAVRRGRTQLVVNGSGGPRCPHVSEGVNYLCTPMSAQGEMLGVLHLQLNLSDAREKDRRIAEKQRLVLSISDQFGLALANLRLRETLKALSIRDPLTGLFNRRYLEESLDRELRRALRRNLPVAIIMLDVDHFKRFNDAFGHEAGDRVLKEVAALLKANSRAEDIACRYGGEEFTLILPEMELESARARAEQLNEAVRHLRVLQGEQFLGVVTVSLGVAIFPTHGATGRDIMHAADGALYRAKQSGRDRVEVAGAATTTD